ncbi:fungal Zn binuclear cluster domain-containing protein [Penicillium macrosclerotiorum]|uniref:fungal Zn binuclear cluster domain-containing protein n=1 Tax=Penicillium macrosclerotiorum TaxID=303699 RepID=UPI00254728A6|nr:fungal Zn binuclear cluster domain-containing protein [Penicillium macrosclerotiorum]KAJ5688835.1 fungal Zn binuclear cluster domain-containing protein [Penicillium macrosclerotiorum]
MPPPFQLQEHCYLYRYFASKVLPRMNYMLQLALEFYPLMGALVSVAGMELASPSGWPVHRAIESYIQTIQGLQEVLSRKELIIEDALLATVVTLSVFENSRKDVPPNVRPHVMASSAILTNRRPRWPRCPQAPAVFDRICVESFVYHASLMMIFEPSLDVLSDSHEASKLHLYFSDPTHGSLAETQSAVATQPILHVPYKFFILIADITKLARISYALNDSEIFKWNQLNHQFRYWADCMRASEEVVETLFVLAMEILLSKMNPFLFPEEIERVIEACFEQASQLIPLLDTSSHFTSFLLWPLTILGAVAYRPCEKDLMQKSISHLTTAQSGGQAVWVLRRLQNIWPCERDSETGDCRRYRTMGLQALLNGTT